MKGFKKSILFGSVVMLLLTGCGAKQETTATTSQATETIVTTQEQTEKQESAAYVLSIDSNNSWDNNGMQAAQFDGVIRNQSDTAGKDWKVELTVPEGSSIESSWNGEYQLEGTTLTISPEDYNSVVEAGAEVTFGFILDTESAFTPEQGILTIGGKSYALGENVGDTATADTEESKEQQDALTEEQDTSKEVAAKDTSGTPLANHGKLSVKGTDIVDESGKVYQLKGVSTHGINWFPDYVNEDAFASLSEYGVNAIRLAMYTADYNGYCSGGNTSELEALVDKGVTACTDLGMYVIIDWHILNDNDPNQNKAAAKTFFETMSGKYADYSNVIYEICNEPNGSTTWENVKSYAEEIIPVIRKKDKDALIIVGTPNWSQDVDVAAGNPITGQDNILYAVHFYASTHKEEIREKVKQARSQGLPIIVSECSICEASGDGTIDYDEADAWMELINQYHLSYFAWNLSNKDEQSSLLKSSVTKTSGFTEDDFSDTGSWFLKQFSK